MILYLTLETVKPLGLPSRTYAGLKFSKNIQTQLLYLSRCLGLQKYSKKHYAQVFFEVFFQKKFKVLIIKEIIFN